MYYGIGPKSTPQLENALKSITLLTDDKKTNQIQNVITSLSTAQKSKKFKYYKACGGHQIRIYEYLKLLEYILQFIEKSLSSNVEKEEEYIKILKTQLSPPELFIILLSAGTLFKSFAHYIKKYNLIDSSHQTYLDSFDIGLYQYFENLINQEYKSALHG